jgi:hypothetical protein
MRNRLLWLIVVVVPCGCHSPQNPAASPSADPTSVARLTDPADYPKHVGKRVEVVGEVTNTKCPQVCGVDVWSLDAHRGRRVRLRGTLRETVVTQEAIDEMYRTGQVVANRGAGRFYSLDDMELEVLP